MPHPTITARRPPPPPPPHPLPSHLGQGQTFRSAGPSPLTKTAQRRITNMSGWWYERERKREGGGGGGGREFRFSFSFHSRWHLGSRKGPYALRPVLQQSLQGCPRNSAKGCLVEHRSFPTSERGMSDACYFHLSFVLFCFVCLFVCLFAFLQVISAVILWPLHAQKIPQASKHFCSAKLQIRARMHHKVVRHYFQSCQ